LPNGSAQSYDDDVHVFISYAHEDERLRDRLADHLALLKRQGMISDWYDREISAGTEWKGKISSQLDTSQIILLLISSDFIASEYCYDVEMTRALERHDAGLARVIPIFLRPVDLHGVPFSKLQGLPADARPVTKWRNRDEAFADIAKGIREAVEAVRGRGPRRVDEVNDSKDATYWYERGIRALSDSQLDAALHALSRAIEANPLAAYAFYNRGLTYYLLKDDNKAIADFDRALELGVDDALLFRNRGNAYSHRGDVGSALADYARAIELEPYNPLPYLNRGEIYQNTLQNQLAIADFKVVLDLPCDDSILRVARRRLLELGIRID
jgi:tetratricopeptide (TPR) repeat protein